MTKQEWRKVMKEKLLSLSDETFQRLSKRIEERLYQDEWWQEANTVGLTVSMGREIETRNVIAEGWRKGKQMAVPKSNPASHRLNFYVITSFAQLEEGHYGILEPIPSRAYEIKKELIDLLIVPGLVFDEEGYRIGYGGGYFDRFLVDYPNRTIGLAFEMQRVSRIPHDRFDHAVQRLITEKKTYRFE